MRLVTLIALLACTTPVFTRQGGLGAGRGQPSQWPNALVGRVTGSAGEPVANVFVTVLSPRPSGTRQFTPVDVRLSVLTNAQGEFRLPVPYLGDFYVVALPHNPVLGPDRQPNRTGYGKTFYPHAGDLKDAKTISVAASGPAHADITLIPARLSVVVGTVTGSNGQPIQSGVLGITHGDGLYGLDDRGMIIQPGGRFLLPASPPGTYFLQFHESTWPPPRGVVPDVSGAKVVVANADILNVQVIPIHMVAATGRLVVAPELRPLLPQPSTIQVGATPVDFNGNPGPFYPGVVQNDLTFAFKMWPGQARIHVTLPSQTVAVKAIRLNGIDITDKPVEFVEGQQLSGLEIEIAKTMPAGH